MNQRMIDKLEILTGICANLFCDETVKCINETIKNNDIKKANDLLAQLKNEHDICYFERMVGGKK